MSIERAFTRSATLTVAVLALAAARPDRVAAQTVSPDPASDRPERVTTTGFLGATNGNFIGGGFSLGFLEDEAGWILRWARYEEFVIFGPDPALSVWDLSAQRAVVAGHGVLQATASAGPAVVGGLDRTRDDVGEPFRTVGAAGAAQLTLALLPFLGIGAELSALLNSRRSYAAFALRLTAGNLR